MSIRRCSVAICALVLAVLPAAGGPLKDYVETPDPNYAYSLANTIEGLGHVVYVVDMTSQSWRPGDATPHIWQHWLTIVRPAVVHHDTALLVISGGNNKHDRPPDSAADFLVSIARHGDVDGQTAQWPIGAGPLSPVDLGKIPEVELKRCRAAVGDPLTYNDVRRAAINGHRPRHRDRRAAPRVHEAGHVEVMVIGRVR